MKTYGCDMVNDTESEWKISEIPYVDIRRSSVQSQSPISDYVIQK